MIKHDDNAARNYFLEARPGVVSRRVPTDAFDYGDERTVLLHLKRVGSSIGDLKEDNYGMYLGQQNDGYVVAIKNFIGNDFIGCEVFETIEEMKTIWQLD